MRTTRSARRHILIAAVAALTLGAAGMGTTPAHAIDGDDGSGGDGDPRVVTIYCVGNQPPRPHWPACQPEADDSSRRLP